MLQITAFGIFWLIVLICAAYKGIDALALCVVFSAMVQGGAVAVINNAVILPPILVSCIFFDVYFLLVYRRKIVIPKFIFCFLLFIFYVIISSVISSAFFVGTGYVISNEAMTFAYYNGRISVFSILYLYIYALSALSIYNLGKEYVLNFNKLIDIMVVTVFVIGIWQYGTVWNIIPRLDFISDFIYSARRFNAVNFAYTLDIASNRAVRLYSCFMEPSYFAGFISACISFYLSKKQIKIKDNILIILLFVMLLFSFSATGYVACAVSILVVLLASEKRRELLKIIKIGVGILFLVLLIIAIMDMWSLVYKYLFNKMESGSAQIRGTWNKSCLSVFKETYMLGLGSGICRGSSLFYTLLSSFGIIGFALYLYFIYNLLYGKGISLKMHTEFKSYFMFALSVIIAQFVAIGIFDYSIFIQALLIISYQKGRLKNNFAKNYGTSIAEIAE